MSHMTPLFANRGGQSLVKTRDAAEHIAILLRRATTYLGEGRYALAKEAVCSALIILERQEVIFVFDHLRALIIAGRLHSARGDSIAALATHKIVAERIFEHTGILDVDDPETAALLALHEHTLVDARNTVEAEELERMAG
jgi:hypothetical protein